MLSSESAVLLIIQLCCQDGDCHRTIMHRLDPSEYNFVTPLGRDFALIFSAWWILTTNKFTKSSITNEVHSSGISQVGYEVCQNNSPNIQLCMMLSWEFESKRCKQINKQIGHRLGRLVVINLFVLVWQKCIYTKDKTWKINSLSETEIYGPWPMTQQNLCRLWSQHVAYVRRIFLIKNCYTAMKK